MTAFVDGNQPRPSPTGPRNAKPSPSRPLRPPVNNRPPQPSSPNTIATPHQRSWKDCTEVKLKIMGLPPTAKTIDLWKLFKAQGHIVRIDLFEDRSAERTREGIMIFSPPPKEAFWERRSDNLYCVSYKSRQGPPIQYRLTLRLEDSRRNNPVQSMVNPKEHFAETMVMQASRLDFGFMDSQFSMMCMHSTQANEHKQITFTLKLLRREVVIEFPVDHPERQGAKHDRDLDRVKFQIPFRELRTVWEIDSVRGERALVISLSSPPAFFRKLVDLDATHNEGRFWSEQMSWARQTEIIDPKKAAARMRANKGPLTFRNERAMIDIGRWTTYKLTFTSSKEGNETYNKVRRALYDYNIKMKAPGGDFRLVQRRDTSVWDLIDTSEVTESPNAWAIQVSNGGLHIPWSVRYQLEACISQGFINERHVSGNFIERLKKMGEDNAKLQLETVVDSGKRFFDPMAIFDLAVPKSSLNKNIPKYCVLSRSATVTPSTIYYSNPTPEMSNRILRKYDQYADQFLRVRFTDERSEGRLYSSNDNSRLELYNRVFQCLREGIKIGDRHFYFLAASNSQFREHAAYFFAPKHGYTPARLRADMGNLSGIRSVSKYASRLGQCFSTTRGINHPTLNVTTLGDTERNGHTFTDGCGIISEYLAKMIAHQLRITDTSRYTPSLFQFRLGGAKGVTAVWPSKKLDGLCEIQIRKSQYKFPAKYGGLEIIQWSTYSAPRLNRQLILVLKSLQVRDHVFIQKLNEELALIEGAMQNERLAICMLQQHVDYNHMSLTFANIVNDGFITAQDPFAVSVLRLWRSFTLKQLKEKAAIPVKDGAFLLGCVDEAACLRGWYKSDMYNAGRDEAKQEAALAEIFVQVPDYEKDDGAYKVIEGICIVARNPSLHFGDIRVVRAVNKPELRHMRDVVVFPQTGDRDIPNMCSGGDLDGDDFVVIWDQSLIPPRSQWDEPAMNFTPPPPATVDNVTIEDVQQFFVQYLQKDLLGQIAVWHMANADYLQGGVRSQRCIALAGQHSLAVDYPKSGTPPNLTSDLRPQKFPHFMNNGRRSKDQEYKSHTVLGELYDKVPNYDFQPLLDLPFDQRILNAHRHTETRLKLVSEIKAEYDAAIRRVMAQHEIATEFEVWSTFVMQHAKAVNDYKIHEEIGRISSTIKEQYCDIIVSHAGGRDYQSLAPWVAAMYTVTSTEKEEKLALLKKEKNVLVDHGGAELIDPSDMPFISFPWLFHRELGQILQVSKVVDEIAMAPAAPKAKKVPMAMGDLEDPNDEIAVPSGLKHRGDLLELFDDATEELSANGPSRTGVATGTSASVPPSASESSDRVDYKENEMPMIDLFSGQATVPNSVNDGGVPSSGKGKSRPTGYDLGPWQYRDHTSNTSSKTSDSGRYQPANSRLTPGSKGQSSSSSMSNLHDDLIGVNEELLSETKGSAPSRTPAPSIVAPNQSNESDDSATHAILAIQRAAQVQQHPDAVGKGSASKDCKPSATSTTQASHESLHATPQDSSPGPTDAGKAAAIEPAPEASLKPGKPTTKATNKQKSTTHRIGSLPPAPPAHVNTPTDQEDDLDDHHAQPTWYTEERDEFGNFRVSLPETLDSYNPYSENK